MSTPTELSFEEILKYMLAHNGKVTNHELVKHFKVFLMNPDMRDEARNTFKKHVNTLAIIKNQNNEKWLILKKKYLPNNAKESESASNKVLDAPTTVTMGSPLDPPQPPYIPPPPVHPNQDYSIINSLIQDCRPFQDTLSCTETHLNESKESIVSVQEEMPVKVPPRKKSSDKVNEKNSSITLQSEQKHESLPPALSPSRSESMLVDNEQTISVKERKQMFNRMASESDVLKSNKVGSNFSQGVDEEDRASLDPKSENDPLDSKQKQWILWAARGDYHTLAKMCKENPKLAKTKVLSALSFYASGSYQRVIGASAHSKMHQVSVSNCVRAVTTALNNNHFRRKYIHFPQTREERTAVKNGFYHKFGMPGVLGCIDGTHIAIVKPAQYEERYFNRKRYHSLNAQIVCDSDLNILNMDASHGGADHDSFVWNHHPLQVHLEHLHQAENETVWFLGDSGYPLRRTLMTPVLDTEPDTPERYYTDLHCRVRNTVERCIGVLKSRWRCLLVDRKLHYHPTTAGYITNACVVLHNIANAARLPVPEIIPQEQQNEANMQINNRVSIPGGGRDLAAGVTVRNALIQRLWAAR